MYGQSLGWRSSSRRLQGLQSSVGYGILRNVSLHSSHLSVLFLQSDADTWHGRLSTFAALLLDIHTQRKTTRRGIYALPEDDKDAQKLNELKTARVRAEGYDAPKDQSTVSTASGAALQEQDTGYHSRYGVE